MNDSIIPSRRATFKAATIGMHAWVIAKVCNTLRPGWDFRGCTKKQLREEFASGDLAHVSGREFRAAIDQASSG